jgi:hypothetical protein
LNILTTAKKLPEEQPSGLKPLNVAEALEFIRYLRETSEKDGDTSEWETLKQLFDEDRLSERKFFANE